MHFDFLQSYWKAFCDGNLDIEKEDSGFESSADSNGLLGVTENAANTAGRSQSKGFSLPRGRFPSLTFLHQQHNHFCHFAFFFFTSFILNHFFLLHLDDVHSSECKADVVSSYRPVQSFIM